MCLFPRSDSLEWWEVAPFVLALVGLSSHRLSFLHARGFHRTPQGLVAPVSWFPLANLLIYICIILTPKNQLPSCGPLTLPIVGDCETVVSLRLALIVAVFFCRLVSPHLNPTSPSLRMYSPFGDNSIVYNTSPTLIRGGGSRRSCQIQRLALMRVPFHHYALVIVDDVVTSDIMEQGNGQGAASPHCISASVCLLTMPHPVSSAIVGSLTLFLHQGIPSQKNMHTKSCEVDKSPHVA